MKIIKKIVAGSATLILVLTTLAPMAMAGELTNTSVEASDLTSSATSSYTFNFTTVTDIGPYDRIAITFPAGFDVSNASVNFLTACNGTMNGFFGKVADGQTINIARNPAGNPNDYIQSGGQAETCTITNVVNPASATASDTFTIQTLDQTDSWAVKDSATVTGVTIGDAQNVPEFSTYMLILTVIVVGFMATKGFARQQA